MAQKCPRCGGAWTATGADNYTCLLCGKTSKYTAPEPRGRVDNPDGPAHYHGDEGVIYG